MKPSESFRHKHKLLIQELADFIAAFIEDKSISLDNTIIFDSYLEEDPSDPYFLVRFDQHNVYIKRWEESPTQYRLVDTPIDTLLLMVEQLEDGKFHEYDPEEDE